MIYLRCLGPPSGGPSCLLALRWPGRQRWELGVRMLCGPGEDGRLGRMRRASLTSMSVWGAFPALRWREMPFVARRMCSNREFSSYMATYWCDMARHMRHKRRFPSAAPSACTTNASSRQLFPSHAPQTAFSVGCLSVRTNEAPRRLSMPSTKCLRHSRAVCAPHIEVGTPLAAFSPEKPCERRVVAGTIRSGKYIVKR